MSLVRYGMFGKKIYRIDNYDYTSINIHKFLNNEPFVLTSQVEQIFYAKVLHIKI